MRLRAVRGTPESGILKALRETFEGKSEFVKLRIFRAGGAADADYFCLVSMTPSSMDAIGLLSFGPLAAYVDMVNVYAPYDIAG